MRSSAETTATSRVPGAAHVAIHDGHVPGTCNRTGELARSSLQAQRLRVMVVAAGLAQAIGIALFFHTVWTRIRPVGSQLRDGRGERF